MSLRIGFLASGWGQNGLLELMYIMIKIFSFTSTEYTDYKLTAYYLRKTIMLSIKTVSFMTP